MVTAPLLLRVAVISLLSIWFMPPSVDSVPYMPSLSFPLSPLSALFFSFTFPPSISFIFTLLYSLHVSSHPIYSFLIFVSTILISRISVSLLSVFLFPHITSSRYLYYVYVAFLFYCFPFQFLHSLVSVIL